MKKIESLTSLRFFAAACIVIGHGGSRFHYSLDLFDLRYGVTFFFVLSGFILSYNYPKFDLKNDLRVFVAARIARLYPAYLVTTIAAIMLVAPVSNGGDLLRLFLNLLLLQSWVPISSWHYSYNSVAWSISTEIFFYMVFPFALLLLKKSTRRFAAMLLVPAAIMVIVATGLKLSLSEGGSSANAWGIIYVNPVSRVTEFLAGMLAYEYAERLLNYSRNWSKAKASAVEIGALSLLLASIIFATYVGKNVLRGIVPQLSIYVQVISSFPAIALFVMVMRQEKGVISGFLCHRWLIYLGEISFSLYLVHQIVIRWMFTKYALIISSHLGTAFAVYCIASIMLASVIFHFVEKPLRVPVKRLLTGEPQGSRSSATASVSKVTPL